MEGNQKNAISKLLMMVGVVFILIAGSIFVTTAWQYLPEWGKQLCLALAAAGLFAGSQVAAKKENLHIAETALYYLGTAFVGFFMISILGGNIDGRSQIAAIQLQTWAFKAGTAGMVMTAPMLFRCVVKKKGMDVGILILLVDSVLVNLSVALSLKVQGFTLLLAILTLVLAVIDYRNVENGIGDTGLGECIFLAYIIHGIMSLMCTLLVFSAGIDNVLPGITAALVFIIFLATGITNRAREYSIFRVCNSVSLLWLVYVLVDEVNGLLGLTENMRMVSFVAFFLNLIVMVCMKRNEIRYIMLALGIVVPFAQILSCTQMWEAKNSLAEYLPYSLLLAAACVIIGWAEEDKAYRKVAAIQAASYAVQMLMAARCIAVDGMGSRELFPAFVTTFSLLLAQSFMIVSVMAEDRTLKQLMNTFVLGSEVVAMYFIPLSFINLYFIHLAEWICLVTAIGTVIFGRIWDNDKEAVKMLQFVTTCALLFILLIHNLYSGELGCVLVLGLTGIIILLVAAIRNRKEYVIASSVTLIIMALYITREFWLNIEWWIYLFVAGVALVGLAIKKEREN